MPRQWVKDGRKKCSRDLCKRPAVVGERYCEACKTDLKQRMQDEGYLERRPIEESYRGRYAKETRIEE